MLLQLLLQVFSLVTLVSAGCKPSKILSTGFKVVGYSYPHGSTEGWNKDFLQTGYKARGKFFSTDEVTDVAFYYGTAGGIVTQGELYGETITITNFTIELTGYFVPDETGEYTWSIDNADDGAALSLVTVGGCCNDVGQVTSEFAISTLRGYAGAGTASSKSTTVTLEKGLAYAIKIVNFNWNGPASLGVSYVTPSGKTVTNFDHIHQVTFQTDNCEVPPVLTTTTTYGTNSTFTPSDCADVETCTVTVVPPEVRSSSSALYSNVTSSAPQTLTETDTTHTIITVTSCSDHKCVTSIVSTTSGSQITSSTSAFPSSSDINSSVPSTATQSTGSESYTESSKSGVVSESTVTSTETTNTQASGTASSGGNVETTSSGFEPSSGTETTSGAVGTSSGVETSSGAIETSSSIEASSGAIQSSSGVYTQPTLSSEAPSSSINTQTASNTVSSSFNPPNTVVPGTASNEETSSSRSGQQTSESTTSAQSTSGSATTPGSNSQPNVTGSGSTPSTVYTVTVSSSTQTPVINTSFEGLASRKSMSFSILALFCAYLL
ncbi:hypothetical protein E0198_004342 [Clavispora lusitaniae]|nr:hypothetical protein E0198_004342 [Clavispora lusitaniae]